MRSAAVRIYAHQSVTITGAERWWFRVESDAQTADYDSLSEAEEAAKLMSGCVSSWPPLCGCDPRGLEEVLA